MTTQVATTELTVSEALSHAHREELERDERVFVIGEGIGRQAIYGITQGLYKRFGPKRVIDTPLSETAFIGASLGAAATGSEGQVVGRPILGGLHHEYERLAA